MLSPPLFVSHFEPKPGTASPPTAAPPGRKNPSKALADHVDDDDKLNNETLSTLPAAAAHRLPISRGSGATRQPPAVPPALKAART